ncbi:MAG: hypothetical protein HUU57_07010 [Bdellovibrio sp.]|nr:hypothetical protein [Bdellovibrio sp.]
MKFLIPLLSFLLGNAKNFMKEPTEALTQQLVLHIRSISLLLTGCVGSLALSCVGLSLFISRLAGQFDAAEEFSFTISLGIYLGMTVVFGGLLAFCLRRKTWLAAMGFADRSAAEESRKKSGALESAVALLVMDFVEERQSRRQQQNENRQAEPT